MPGALLVIDESTETADVFVSYAERHGHPALATADAAHADPLLMAARPAIIALGCDLAAADPVDVIAHVAHFSAAGGTPLLVLFSREPRLLEIYRQAGLTLGLADIRTLLVPIDFRALLLTPAEPAVALAG